MPSENKNTLLRDVQNSEFIGHLILRSMYWFFPSSSSPSTICRIKSHLIATTDSYCLRSPDRRKNVPLRTCPILCLGNGTHLTGSPGLFDILQLHSAYGILCLVLWERLFSRDAAMELSKYGKLIAIEGMGESVTIEYTETLAAWLRTKRGLDIHVTREPTEGPAGTLIKLARLGRIQLDARTYVLLSVSDRLDHMFNKVDGLKEILNKNRHVLCNQYLMSEWAYAADSFEFNWLRKINEISMLPNLTIFIDIPIVKYMQRTGSDPVFFSGLVPDQGTLDRIHDGYLKIGKLLKNEGQEIHRVNGNAPVYKIQNTIQNIVDGFFNRQLQMLE